ncbi:MAG TPA: heme-binding protein [Methyloceanibacter sp.]|nr:heme-binding protein [Methyloceanibacter sp.]
MWQSISYYALLALESVAGVFGIRLYEEPQYKLLDRVGERVEIRRYASRVAAEVTLPNTGKDARGDAFQLLFDYISGANRGTSDTDAEGIGLASFGASLHTLLRRALHTALPAAERGCGHRRQSPVATSPPR